MKHPLARALRGAGLSEADAADRLDVDPKTVGRWLAGRTPYARHRLALARLTGWPSRDLWPHLARPGPAQRSVKEVHLVYPQRSHVPVDVWQRLFARATEAIDILAHGVNTLPEETDVLRTLREKAAAGVRLRVALADPEALVIFAPLAELPGVELRLDDTVRYASIYRVDDQLLVNIHVYGVPASQSPLLCLRAHETDGMTAMYVTSFERAWAAARPL